MIDDNEILPQKYTPIGDDHIMQTVSRAEDGTRYSAMSKYSLSNGGRDRRSSLRL